MINADGGAFAAALMATALTLRALLRPAEPLAGQQSFWLTLGALTKPPNLALILLPLMAPPGRSAMRWARAGLIVLPALAVASALEPAQRSRHGDLADGRDHRPGRRRVRSGHQTRISARQILSTCQPLSPRTLMQEDYLRGLWVQAIGVLGLFDTVLRGWTYPLLTALLLGTFLVRIPFERGARIRIAMVAGLIILGYGAGLYLIGYLVFTPQGAPVIWGIQGRYFAPVLPLLAIAVAALGDRSPGERITSALAIALALLSGLASIDAVLRTDWNL